jgi:uncharacterized protein (TIGR03086 family)
VSDAIDRYVLASAGFERRLRWVRDWTLPTPCTEWNLRQLVNHVVRGNVNYIALLDGGTAEDFRRLRDADALGDDPVGAFNRSVQAFVTAFRRPGASERILDYPLGKIRGEQALAVRTTDTVVHTWDLARAIGADDRLDAGLVAWIDENLEAIYADLDGLERFFAKPERTGSSAQDRLLRRMGR